MPMKIVPWLALLVFILGATMLFLRDRGSASGAGYDTLRLVHILLAIGLLGVFEASLGRVRRLGRTSAGLRQFGMAGRITITLALLVGLFLLVSLFSGLVSGSAFGLVVLLHALFGISGTALAAYVFTRKQI